MRKTKVLYILITLFVGSYTIAYAYLSNTATVLVNESSREEGMIKVSGIGYPPADVFDIRRARLLARRAAVLDGYRNLLSSVSSLSRWVENGNTIINRGFIKGATVLNTRYSDGNSVEVDIGLNIHLRRNSLKRITKIGYKVVFANDLNVKPPNTRSVITKEEWMKLIGN